MYIENVYKLKLTPEEADVLKRCGALLEEILHDFCGDYLSNVEAEDLAFTSDVLKNLSVNKELY